MRLLVILYSLFFFSITAKAQIDSVLLKAIKSCDLTAVQQRLMSKIDINTADKNGANALTWAVYYCDLPIIKSLVKRGARVVDSAVIYTNEEGGYYSNLQEIAAGKGKLELLQYLADSLQLSLDEKGFDPYSRTKEGRTPLSCAAEYGQMAIIKYLLQKGVKIDVLDARKTSTALIKAAESGQWAIFDLLMRTDANKKRFGKQADYFIDASAKLKQPFATPKAKELKVRQLTLELRQAYFGELSFGYAFGLSCLAGVYDDLGEYEKAKDLFQKAIETFKKVSGEDRFVYASALNGLAFTYFNMGQYEKALPLLEQALSITRKIYGEENPDYATILRFLALIYVRMGIYDKALPLYLQTLAIIRKVQGE
ncbi:MAG: tetratricopeptide repeat protein, partial [Segetibacter sp.]